MMWDFLPLDALHGDPTQEDSVSDDIEIARWGDTHTCVACGQLQIPGAKWERLPVTSVELTPAEVEIVLYWADADELPLVDRRRACPRSPPRWREQSVRTLTTTPK